MAKRKRLTPAQSDYLQPIPGDLETKSIGAKGLSAPAPIAQVAGEASATAALQDLAGEVKRARDEGRMILSLPLDQVDAGYLVRDRMIADEEELFALVSSIEARGQQTPVEVVELGENRYGLISGWRRLSALRQLHDRTGQKRFATIQALLRRPDGASDAYVSMVEENEIRVGLSYYERARVAAKAVEQGVYANEKQALLTLFSSASRAKRSKIRSFLEIYRAADDLLKFPMAIAERLGLALSKALQAHPGRIADLRVALERAKPETAEAEIACLEAALKQGQKKALKADLETHVDTKLAPPNVAEQAGPGIEMTYTGRSVMLTGPGVTEAFRGRLAAWLKAQE